MVCGIYKITINDKHYVGQSACIKRRKKQHLQLLSNGMHPNIHLQRAFDKYDDFRFDILEKCGEEELNDREMFWIKKIDSKKTGYNLSDGGNGCRNPNDEIRWKIGTANRGKKHSKEQCLKISQAVKGEGHPLFGVEVPEERKLKISQAQQGEKHHNFGKKLSEETKQKISLLRTGEKNPFHGKALSEEHRKKISDSHMGCKNHFYGRNHSEEVKAKISKNKKGQKPVNRIKVFAAGKVYNSLGEFAKAHRISLASASNYLSGKRKMPGKFKDMGLCCSKEADVL